MATSNLPLAQRSLLLEKPSRLTSSFPESRRQACYLMSIHEHLPAQVKRELKQVGWTKGIELAKLRSQSGDDSEQNLITLCTPCHANVHCVC
jgi:hypothetical protein